MNRTKTDEVLGQGRFLRLVRRDDWEFVERTKPVRAAFIAAVTADNRLLLTKEHRVPLGRAVVSFPAGLVGDLDGTEAESLTEAVQRELLEETGYAADRVTFLTEGPAASGETSQVIAVVLAEGLRQVGPGGGLEGESIEVCPVPLAEADAWLDARARVGYLIDPKVYAGLYFIQRRAARAAAPRRTYRCRG